MPNVWFHGSQSISTGGSSARKARPARIIAWLAHSIRWVLITPLGWPVEPEVNRILARVSGPTFACAASTIGVGWVLAKSSNGVVRRSVGGLAVETTSTLMGTAAAM